MSNFVFKAGMEGECSATPNFFIPAVFVAGAGAGAGTGTGGSCFVGDDSADAIADELAGGGYLRFARGC